VVTGDKSIGFWLRLWAAAGVVVVISLAAGVVAVMTLSGTQAQAPAPKQQQPAPKQQPQAPKPAQIDRNGVLILIRETLLALDQANKTGNYTVLRDLGSPDFQANSAARLTENLDKVPRSP
jgi:hypothetical protein